MKTSNIKKNLYTVLFTIIAFSIFNLPAYAQEKEKEVYSETIKNFEGKYKGEIDISSEDSGTYFLKIEQGNKIGTRKIIVE
ncbi:MAG: T9SS type A sorting domain-containing protein [Bacteroidales bacterium]|nr:T9SS type A sorting domain-containing protein [Bacteroidales bacterium]